MTQRRWKVGLLGAGYISDVHIRALKCRSDTEIVAVCDLALGKAEAVASKFGIRQSFSSLDDLLNSELDVVHVLLPPDSHVDATRRILESGRHAFLEKPMGLAAAECHALVELAKQRKIKVGVDHNFLFLRSYEKLRRHAADGTLGRLDQVTVNWMYPLGLIQFGPYSSWILRDPRNLFFELGPHLLAFVMDLVGPLDSLRTSVSLPVDLPGGGRVYRHWHVHGSKRHTAVDLNLSVIPGPSNRSLVVRGRGAIATCYFDRDLYCLDEPVGYGLFDNFVTAEKLGLQLGVDAGRNLLRSTIGVLRKSAAADPFADSVARSVAGFYNMLGGQLEARMDGQLGVNVIAECERIVAKADLEPREAKGEVWTVVPPKQQPNVLVLGGTGFIGRYLVKALVAKGFGVRVATRRLGPAQIALAGLPVEIVQGDLADPSFMDAALGNIDFVYHLAKADGVSWDDYYRHDVLVTQNIADRALAKGVKRFIYTGTIASYYTARANQIITADTPLDSKIHRRNHYARSKAACEALLMELHRRRGLPVVILRPGIVIGKGFPTAHWGVGMFLSETRVKFWGDGQNRLPFVLVEDVAEALVLALDKNDIEGQVFLLSDEPLLSARDYVSAVADASGTRLRAEPTSIWKYYLVDLLKEAVKHLIRHPNRRIPSYRDLDARSNRARFDSTKTKEILGWRPAGTRAELVARGIVQSVRDQMR